MRFIFSDALASVTSSGFRLEQKVKKPKPICRSEKLKSCFMMILVTLTCVAFTAMVGGGALARDGDLCISKGCWDIASCYKSVKVKYD